MARRKIKFTKPNGVLAIIMGMGAIIAGIIFAVTIGADTTIIPELIFFVIGAFWIILGIYILSKIKSDEEEYKEYLDRLAKSNMAEVDKMTGREFEVFLQALYIKLGYEALLTRTTGDYGADLILKKDGEIIAVQAKHSINKISISAVQEVIGARGHYHTYQAAVVTNNFFTKPAQNLAQSNGITLIDRNKLAELMCKVQKPKDEPAETNAPEQYLQTQSMNEGVLNQITEEIELEITAEADDENE